MYLEDLYNHLIHSRIIKLIMNKIFKGARNVLRQTAMNMIWSWQSSYAQCMFHILGEVGLLMRLWRHPFRSLLFDQPMHTRLPQLKVLINLLSQMWMSNANMQQLNCVQHGSFYSLLSPIIQGDRLSLGQYSRPPPYIIIHAS